MSARKTCQIGHWVVVIGTVRVVVIYRAEWVKGAVVDRVWGSDPGVVVDHNVHHQKLSQAVRNFSLYQCEA